MNWLKNIHTLPTQCYRTVNMFYQAIYHEVPNPGSYSTRPLVLKLSGRGQWAYSTGYELPVRGPRLTEITTMCYKAVDHVLPDSGHILLVRSPWVTSPWNTFYWAVCSWITGPSTMWHRAVEHVLPESGHVLPGRLSWVTVPCTISYWAVRYCTWFILTFPIGNWIQRMSLLLTTKYFSYS